MMTASERFYTGSTFKTKIERIVDQIVRVAHALKSRGPAAACTDFEFVTDGPTSERTASSFPVFSPPVVTL
jgi:hypothetical protein